MADYNLSLQGRFSITGTSPSSATTAVVGSVVTGLQAYRFLSATAELVGATGGTLDVYLQASPDLGVTWVDIVHFTQLAAGAAAINYKAAVNRSQSQAPVQVGIGLTPALGATLAAQGDFGDRIRCIATGGASTSAGAAITILLTAST